MNKILTASFVVASSVVLMACTLPGQQAATQPTTSTPPKTDQTGDSTSGGMMDIAKNIMAGAGYRCTMKVKETGQEMKYAFKGKQVSASFADPTNAKKQMNMITTPEFMYTWDPVAKKGMKLPIPKDVEKNTQTPGTPQIPDASDAKAWQEYQSKYQMSCAPAALTDAEFTPPTDVEFQDLSAMMKNLPKQPK